MYKTIEQVGIGHPDKVADRISDSILDECLKQDKYSRVAVETLIKDDKVIVAGEITSSTIIDYYTVITQVFKEVGYDYRPKVQVNISRQSNDISQGVDIGGAGDQGIMVGYASNETKNYMPKAHEIATRILMLANEKRIDGTFKYAKSDMKSQVSINSETDKIETIIVSIQHSESYNELEFKSQIIEIVDSVVKEYNMNADYNLYINPTGRFVIGGSIGDTGLTGRKIIADSYGTVCSHGGGAYSGKDPSKVDRAGAYITRKIAKHIVASDLADIAEVKISYAIGMRYPITLDINCFGSEKVNIDKIKNVVHEQFDLSPAGIIKELDLLKPIYKQVSTFGHFGINAKNMTWEKLDKIKAFEMLKERK